MKSDAIAWVIVAIICAFFAFVGIAQWKDCNKKGGVIIQYSCVKLEKL